MLDPFAGLSAVLGVAPVQVDPERHARKGVPEVVYAAGKNPRLILTAVRDLLERDPNRPIDPARLKQLRNAAATTWLDSQRTGPGVTLQLSPSARDWALARIHVRP